jgi:hypothetical protein
MIPLTHEKQLLFESTKEAKEKGVAYHVLLKQLMPRVLQSFK